MENVNFDKTAKYYKYREQYSKSLIKTLARYLGCDDKTVILDLACGAGELSVELGKYVAKVIAVDKSAQMLACAPRADNIEYIQHDLSLSPFMADSVIDHIVIGRAISYIPVDKLDFIINKSLKKSGKIVTCSCHFSEDIPWFKTYNQIKIQYASSEKKANKLEFTKIRKMDALGFKNEKIIRYTEKHQINFDYLVNNALSRRKYTENILNNMDRFKQELWAAMGPYMNNGKLEGQISSVAYIYKRKAAPVYMINKLFHRVKNMK